MRSFGQARTGNAKRDRMPRRLASATALLTLGGILAGGFAPAHAGGLLEDPCYATCGQYKWFLNHSKDVRDNGQCCISLIKQAKQKEERALKLYEAARDPSNTQAEASDLVREANRMIGKRGKKIRQFIDCVNGVISALGMQKRGFDATAEYAIACGVTPLCEGDQ